MLGYINHSLPGDRGYQNTATMPVPGDRGAGANFEEVLFATRKQSETPDVDPEPQADEEQAGRSDTEVEESTIVTGAEDSDAESPLGRDAPDPDDALKQVSPSMSETRNPTRKSFDLVADLRNAGAGPVEPSSQPRDTKPIVHANGDAHRSINGALAESATRSNVDAESENLSGVSVNAGPKPVRNTHELTKSDNTITQSYIASRLMSGTGSPERFESDLGGEISQKHKIDPRVVSELAVPPTMRAFVSKNTEPSADIWQRHTNVDLQGSRSATEVPRFLESSGHSESSHQAGNPGRATQAEILAIHPKTEGTTSPVKAPEPVGNTTSRPLEGALDRSPIVPRQVPVVEDDGRAQQAQALDTYEVESRSKLLYEIREFQSSRPEKRVFASEVGLSHAKASATQSDQRSLPRSMDPRHDPAASRWNLAPGEPTQVELTAPIQPKVQTSIAAVRFVADADGSQKRSTSIVESEGKPWNSVVKTDDVTHLTGLSPIIGARTGSPANRFEHTLGAPGKTQSANIPSLNRVEDQNNTRVGYSGGDQLAGSLREYFKDGADRRSGEGQIRASVQGDTLGWRAIAAPTVSRNDPSGSARSVLAALRDVPLFQPSDQATWTEKDLEMVAASHVEARTASGSPIAAQIMVGVSNHAASVIRQIIEVSGQLRDGPVEVSLNPEELGRVRMQIAASDQGLVMHITAERGETLDMLRRHIDQLHRDLAAMGFENPRFSFDREGAQEQRRARPKVEADQSASSQTSILHPTTTPDVRAGGMDIRI